MRIIGGKFKGHPLVSFQASHIRPTTDRVKESLFNMLQFYMEGSRVLDLFSGTGSLGLEALSRGAHSVLFVESNRKSLDIIRRNFQQLKLKETRGTEPLQADELRIVGKDVIQFLDEYQGDAFDIVLIDPPFTEAMAHEVMLHLKESKVFHSSTLIAIESGQREQIEEDYSPLIRYNQRNYGDKFLSLFRAKAEPLAEDENEKKSGNLSGEF